MLHELSDALPRKMSLSLPASWANGQPFGLDVAFADPIFGEPDIVVAGDVLGFAGIPPPSLRVYPLETHIAEKLGSDTRASIT